LIEVRSSNEQSIVPAPGDIVTAKVRRTNEATFVMLLIIFS